MYSRGDYCPDADYDFGDDGGFLETRFTLTDVDD
jgi:hypothetical protein